MRHILLIIFSHRSHDNVSPLRTASVFLCFPPAHPRFSHNILVVEWVRTIMPTLAEPRTLSSLILLPLCNTGNHPSFLFDTFLLNFADSPFTWCIATSFFLWVPVPTPSCWLFPMILFQPSSLDSVYILESPRSPPAAPTPPITLVCVCVGGGGMYTFVKCLQVTDLMSLYTSVYMSKTRDILLYNNDQNQKININNTTI